MAFHKEHTMNEKPHLWKVTQMGVYIRRVQETNIQSFFIWWLAIFCQGVTEASTAISFLAVIL